MEGNTILGISPGTRYLGIALQRNGTLYEWRVKNYKGAWSDEKLLKALDYIESLIVTHVVKHIACKVPHSSRSSSALKLLIEKIKAIAKEYKLKLHLYSVSELKEWFNLNIRNRKLLAQHIMAKYPELTHIFLRETKNKNQYYLKIFEAVAAVTQCHTRLK